MVIPLDSPRWDALGGRWVPDLIRRVAAEVTPNYRDGGQWFQVYSDLYHQNDIIPVTYAAFPHLVAAAAAGTVRQRMAVLCLAGNIRILSRTVGAVPTDLLPDFEAAMDRVRASSVQTTREAVRSAATDRWTGLADLLAAVGGLRQPKSGFVTRLAFLAREGWRLEPACPSCGEIMLAELGEPGITTLRLDGPAAPEPARTVPVDRAGYPGLIAKGRAVLASGDSDWGPGETPHVLAALADECGDPVLAARILDLGAAVRCAYCWATFELSRALRPL